MKTSCVTNYFVLPDFISLFFKGNGNGATLDVFSIIAELFRLVYVECEKCGSTKFRGTFSSNPTVAFVLYFIIVVAPFRLYTSPPPLTSPKRKNT